MKVTRRQLKPSPRTSQRFSRDECWEDAAYAASTRVDRKNGVIYNALLLGTKARNKRRYTREAREDALQRGIYEGLQLYIGPHKKGRFAKRSPSNHAGELRNVRLLDNNEIRCDIHVNRVTHGGKLAMEIAERFPNRFGLSHHAWVDGYEEKGEKIVTCIAEVEVADLVKDPGTTDGVFEDTNMAKEDEEVVEDIDTTATPVDTEPEDDDTGGGWLGCVKDLISEIHDDDDLTDDVKMKATKMAMKLKQLLSGDGGGDAEDDDDEEEEEAEEEVDVKKLVADEVRKALAKPRKVKPRKSAARSEATEEVTPAKPKAPPVLKKREDILSAYSED